MHRVPILAAALALTFDLAVPASAAAERRVVLKLGTLAPDGPAWHLLLKDMAEKWREASDGQVVLRIYPGGIAGDEPDMVRKMRFGQLHAALLTIVGLSRLSPEPQVLSTPEMYAGYAELDYVRDRIAPSLEKRLTEKGFVVLNWADAGWIRFFSKTRVQTPEEMKALKIFVWTGDQATVDIWKDFGFQPVALAATDILSSLQTGMIDAAPMTAAGALSAQLFGVARHMLDLRWAPLVGGTVIEAKAWQRIPAEVRPRLLAIARDTGKRLRDEIRQLDKDAIAAMEKRGLVVQPVEGEIARRWRELSEEAYPRIRRDFVGPEFFDRAMELRAEYRKLQASAPTGGGPAARKTP